MAATTSSSPDIRIAVITAMAPRSSRTVARARHEQFPTVSVGTLSTRASADWVTLPCLMKGTSGMLRSSELNVTDTVTTSPTSTAAAVLDPPLV